MKIQQWNSTLKADPTKRLKRTPLRRVSKKQSKKVKDYTKIAIEKSIQIFGYDKCFVCPETNNLVTHHFDKNRNNNKPENLYRLCQIHHDHSGSENLDRVNNRIIKIGK